MRFSLPAALAATCLLVAPLAAQPFHAANHMTVAPLGDGTFEVRGRAELWARDYWCAAGDYGQRVLGLPVTARLVVTEPYSRSHRWVAFGPIPDARPEFRAVVLGLSIRKAGASLSVGQARGFCADYRLRHSF